MIRALTFAFLVAAAPAFAGDAQIIDVQVSKPDMGWKFKVAVRHEDTGWDHYADGWEVLDLDGNRLGYRKLHHPHVNEQPFTRSLRGVMIPDGIRTVVIRVHCLGDGWSEQTVRVELSPSGSGAY